LDDRQFCRAHKINDLITVFFLPPNLTNKHQPMDMGMIAALKVGYRVVMIRGLLFVFDNHTPEQITQLQNDCKRGCKGLAQGAKANVADAIRLIHELWSKDEKYAREQTARKCWLKANILPTETELLVKQALTPRVAVPVPVPVPISVPEINVLPSDENNLGDVTDGRDFESAKDTEDTDTDFEEEVDNITGAFSRLSGICKNSDSDTQSHFDDTVLTLTGVDELSDEDMRSAVEFWIDMESDIDLQRQIFEKELENELKNNMTDHQKN